MTHLVRIATLALVLAAILGGLLGNPDGAAAANGNGQWVPAADGCEYLWDGYAYTRAGCPRADGGIDFYAPGDGVWVYVGSIGFLADGTLWIYQDGVYTYVQAGTASADPSVVDALACASAGMGCIYGGSSSGGGGSAGSNYTTCLLTTSGSVDWDYSGRIETSEVQDECARREGN